MYKMMRRTGALAMLVLAGTLPGLSGCGNRAPEYPSDGGIAPMPGDSSPTPQAGESVELRKILKTIEPHEAAEIFIQKLREPTEVGENVALHIELPPPANQELEESLVRVLGEPEKPLVLFRSDVLVKLDRLPESPGPEFFTAFIHLDDEEIERRLKNEETLASGEFGESIKEMFIFDGRRPKAVTSGLPFDVGDFDSRIPVPVGMCARKPASTPEAWGQSLLITDPAVIQDPARTWDPCTGAGTQGGAWTFAHVMREMAQGSGVSAEEFVLEWLSLWLDDQEINGDLVGHRREEMFAQVIEPWAEASGEVASLDSGPDGFYAELSGPLDLDIAPFRLLAIVNRLDLGETADGRSGYSGSTTSRPKDAGELRFVFGLTEPAPWGAGSEASCNLKDFTVILEYKVPIEGCSRVREWAKRWTLLNTFGGFNDTYLDHLESLTQSVVVHGAAPEAGNQSALAQLRTNETALDPGSSTYELREFTLTDEDPAGDDTPSSGLLRPHTVAQTPDDARYGATQGDPIIGAYVENQVLPGVPSLGFLSKCTASYEVPYFYKPPSFGDDDAPLRFRGGNSLAPPSHWQASSMNASIGEEVCARHQFSLNTCNGCHLDDTATANVHIDPTSGIPAGLSSFLTGGGAGRGWVVGDTQFPNAPDWMFADLERRFQRLYETAWCTECVTNFILDPDFIKRILERAKVVPIDPIDPHPLPIGPIGPIDDLEVVKDLLDVRSEFVSPEWSEQRSVDFVRPPNPSVH